MELRAPYPRDGLLGCHLRVGAFCPHRRNCLSAVVAPFLSLVSPSSEDPSFDQFKAAAPSLSKERPSFIHESGFLNKVSKNSNYHTTMLTSIEKNIDKLEQVLIQSEEEVLGDVLYPDAVWEAQSKFNTLQEELDQLQTLLVLKDNSLKESHDEATMLRTQLQDVQTQASFLSLYKEAQEARQAEELSRLESLSMSSLEILDKYTLVNEAMSNSWEKVQEVWECIVSSNSSSVALKLIGILQKEASHYFQALTITAKELEEKKIAQSDTLLKLQKSADDHKEKDLNINRFQQELAKLNQKNEILAKELAKSEAEVSSLSKKVINTEDLLENERKSLRATRDGLEELDRALGNEESKVDDLFKEVSSLKEQLEQKEAMVQSLSKEAFKNKGLQEIAKKHLAAFHESEKRVQELTSQRNALENQIRSKDLLLEGIKKEAFEKTEALRLAAQIKQELNLCRHREIQLAQEVEREKLQVKDLSRELMENSRAVKAELALQQAEKEMMNINRELSLLRKGIQSRDDVIKLMQEKIDGNIQILQRASNDREKMRKMEAHIYSLESKLREFL